MTTSITSSIGLCPINFKLFNAVNEKLNNIEAALLYSRIKFHELNTKIQKSGKKCIARSREQMSTWFNFSLKKTDRLLTFLELQGLIEKKSGLWYGKKRLFISTSNEFNHVPVNTKILNVLVDQIGSLKGALIFSKIAFAFANTQINHENITWCCIKKDDLSKWSGISIRSIDGILKDLEINGLILKKNFIWKEKLQSHFHISELTLKKLTAMLQKNDSPKKEHSNIEENITENTANCLFKNVIEPVNKIFVNEHEKLKLGVELYTVCSDINDSMLSNTALNSTNEAHYNIQSGHICRQQPANLTTSLRIRTKEKKTKNNTISEKLPTTHEKNNNIIFNKIGLDLTKAQINYIQVAIKNTVERKKLVVSNPKELWEQIKFYVLNREQHKGIQTFKHVISRSMKILSDGNWRTPIGFDKHSVYGVEIKNEREQKLNEWEKQKEMECKSAKIIQNNIKVNYSNHFKGIRNNDDLTNQAMKIAEKLIFFRKGNYNLSENSSIIVLIDNLTKKLQQLILEGANKDEILNYLKL